MKLLALSISKLRLSVGPFVSTICTLVSNLQLEFSTVQRSGLSVIMNFMGLKLYSIPSGHVIFTSALNILLFPLVEVLDVIVMFPPSLNTPGHVGVEFDEKLHSLFPTLSLDISLNCQFLTYPSVFPSALHSILYDDGLFGFPTPKPISQLLVFDVLDAELEDPTGVRVHLIPQFPLQLLLE
jgi:hypothetical protein